MSGVADSFIGKLEGVQGRGPKWRAICPAHDSKHKSRSLAIAEAEDGRLLVKCFAGCSIDQITGAVGITIDELFPPKSPLDDGEHAKRRERKPWSARDVALALERETAIAWVVLADLAAGRPIGKSDRERAGVAAERCAALLRELTA